MQTMRRLIALALAGAVVVAVALRTTGPGDDSGLASLVASLDFADPAAFVAVVETVQQTGRLPADYVTKRGAEALGWRPGSDLCEAAPGRVIGGDRFFNREGRLPEADGRIWFEADLDFACGRRGAKRLVFSNDGLVFVTVDHYDSFVEVAP
jgi:ribonuclease T1